MPIFGTENAGSKLLEGKLPPPLFYRIGTGFLTAGCPSSYPADIVEGLSEHGWIWPGSYSLSSFPCSLVLFLL